MLDPMGSLPQQPQADPSQHPLLAGDPGLLSQLTMPVAPHTPEPEVPQMPQVGSHGDSLISQNLNLLRQMAGIKAPSRSRSANSGAVSPSLSGISGGHPHVVATAMKYVGNPYVYANEGQVVNGQRTFDCSGLVDFVLNRNGFNVPRLTAAGYQSTLPPVNRNQLQPGDPVYFDYHGTGSASHIGIYVGNGKMIAAASPSEGVKYENVDWAHYIGASRLPAKGRA